MAESMNDPAPSPDPDTGAPHAAHENAPGGTDGAGEVEQLARGALENVKEMVDVVDGAAAPHPVDMPDLERHAERGPAEAIGLLNDVNLQVKIELGRTRMLVEDVLRLNAGSVVELDKAAGDRVDIYVNGRHVARGEVLVLNENVCVRVSEIVQHNDRDEH